jgi:hypothetical protein
MEGIVLLPGVEQAGGRSGEMELQADEGLRIVVLSRDGELKERRRRQCSKRCDELAVRAPTGDSITRGVFL